MHKLHFPYIFVAIVGSLVICTGCSGSLQISSAKAGVLGGIPVATYELWVEEGVYTRLARGGACDSTTPYQKLASLPTGPVYYLNVTSSSLAKTSFDLKLNSDGALSELSFNTESLLPQTLTGISDVLKALPALGVAGAGAPPPGVLPACDTGEKLHKVTRYEEWRL